MSGNVALGAGAEFDIIRRLLERWGPRAVGIGDDAAVIAIPRGDSLVASVDTSIEGRHFRTEWLSPREIGYRAVTAALSDLAAMAARPLAVMVAIAIPDAWRSRLDELADGIGEAVEVANTHVVGGNMSDAGEASITTTVLGSAFSPLARGGARTDDAIYVTGRLGAPAAALRALAAGQAPGAYRDRFARPAARLAESWWLADRGASAGIDISDGLVADLGHLARASGVTIDLDASLVPCVDGVDVELALSGGEEYELLVAAPRELDVSGFEHRFGIPLTRIGRVVAATDGVVSVRGARVADLGGYDHFSR